MRAFRYPNYVVAPLSGGGAGINPSRSLFGLADGFAIDTDGSTYYSSDETVTAPTDWAATTIDISPPELISAPNNNFGSASTPFDLGAAVNLVLGFLNGGRQVPSQEAALLAAQQAQARSTSDLGIWIALGATALLVGGVIFAAVKS